ncbi:MAG: AAA family ATPase [Gemmatimonadaceae bacterium]|nr:AAA family ATPase [Gemmatimonadaceae bacterium]
MRPKTVAHAFTPHPGPREPVLSHRDGLPLLRMQTLGAARLQLGYSQLGLQAGMLFPLVLRLVYTPGLAAPRETLLRELWPRHEDERRRGNLRQLLYKLRTMGLNVTMEGEKVQLDRTQVLPMFCVDRTIPLFERDVIRGVEPLGPFVPGLVAPSDELADWLDQTRASVHADVRRVLVEQLRGRRERADWSGAEVISRWLLPFDPLNEDATLTLAECAMLNGSKAEAVAILDRYLAELGPNAGEIRLPATQLRKRFTDPSAKRRPSLANTERHFVGRQQELADLTLSMRRARWHDGSAILLHGPPGIGKTRLLTELSKVAQIEGYREVHLECRETDQRRPLGVFLDVIPELLGYPGALGCSPESLGVLRRLVRDDQPEDSESTTGSDETDSLTSEPSQSSIPLPPERAKSKSIRHALVDILGAISEERPIFLAVEDLHWMDGDSWECMADLVQRCSAMRLFILATSRTRFGLPARPARFPSTLLVRELTSLDPGSSLTLAQRISKDCAAAPSASIEEWFVDAGEGNPLMIRSLVHHWVETGDAGGVPPTLQTLLEQRVERLHEHALRTIQVIVLLGDMATPDRVKAVLQLPTHELLGALEQLTAGDCLKQTDDLFFVAHELIGRAAVERLPRLIQTTLHSTIADLLLKEHVSLESSELLLQAIEHLVDGNRHTEAIQRLLLAEPELLALGFPARVLRVLDASLERAGDPTRATRVQRLKSRLELDIGEYGRALMSAPSGISAPRSFEHVSPDELDALLSSIDSASRADQTADRDELASIAGRIAQSTEATRSVRIRAAEIALVIAANTCDAAIANSTFRSCEELILQSARPTGLDRLSLLFHTIFGDLETARSIASAYVSEAVDRALSTTDAQDLGRAAFALRIAGDTSLGKNAFISALESCKELDAPRLAEYPAWQLAQIAIDEDNIEDLDRWNQELSSLLEFDSDPVSSGFAAAHFCRDAIYRADADRALQFLSMVKSALPRVPTPKASAYVVALELGAQLLNPRWRPSEALVAAAIEKHERTGRFGTSDYLTSVVVDALIRLGRSVEAGEIATRYIERMRRERSPLSTALKGAMRRLGA